jgi:hypothetical protein
MRKVWLLLLPAGMALAQQDPAVPMDRDAQVLAAVRASYVPKDDLEQLAIAWEHRAYAAVQGVDASRAPPDVLEAARVAATFRLAADQLRALIGRPRP